VLPTILDVCPPCGIVKGGSMAVSQSVYMVHLLLPHNRSLPPRCQAIHIFVNGEPATQHPRERLRRAGLKPAALDTMLGWRCPARCTAPQVHRTHTADVSARSQPADEVEKKSIARGHIPQTSEQSCGSEKACRVGDRAWMAGSGLRRLFPGTWNVPSTP